MNYTKNKVCLHIMFDHNSEQYTTFIMLNGRIVERPEIKIKHIGSFDLSIELPLGPKPFLQPHCNPIGNDLSQWNKEAQNERN